MDLTEKQTLAMTKITYNENVFLTGPGGTGKTYLIKKYYDDNRYSIRIGLTSMTGISALMLGGTTLHSYLGIGLGVQSANMLLKKIVVNGKYLKRWETTDTLIIDEVSMLSPTLFKKLEYMARIIYMRKIGIFEDNTQFENYLKYREKLFEDGVSPDDVEGIVGNIDEEKGDILRENNKKPFTILDDKLNKCPPFGGIQIIFSGDCLQLPPINSKNIDKNGEYRYFFFETDTFKRCVNKDNIIYFTHILRQNDKEFQNFLNKVRICDISDDVLDTIKQCEKRLKIEKAKKREISDETLIENKVHIKPAKIFAINSKVDKYNDKKMRKLKKKIYNYNIDISVLDKSFERDIEKYMKNLPIQEKLSICVGSQVMLLKNLDLDSGLVNGSIGIVIDFKENFPRVKFNNGEELDIFYEDWEIVSTEKSTKDKVVLIYSQVPLRLAYSTTCHKSQGQTLDKIEVDMKDFFECGQVYTAFSRVKNLEGLYIKNPVIKNIKAHPNAVKFYKELDE